MKKDVTALMLRKSDHLNEIPDVGIEGDLHHRHTHTHTHRHTQTRTYTYIHTQTYTHTHTHSWEGKA